MPHHWFDRVISLSVCLSQGLDFEDAAKRFWILDKNGLITRKRPDEELTDVTRPFAAIGDDDIEGESLLDVVKRVSSHDCPVHRLYTPECSSYT